MDTKNIYALTIDNYNGVQTKLFNSKADADAALNQTAEELKKNQTEYRMYTDVLYTEECIYRVQSVEDLANAKDRTIYTVNQSVYANVPNVGSTEWRCAFSTMDGALKFFKERLQMYKMQKGSGIKIEEKERYALIYKNGKLVVDLFCDSFVVDDPDNYGTVILRAL
jgi:hypothetical protein